MYLTLNKGIHNFPCNYVNLTTTPRSTTLHVLLTISIHREDMF